MLRLILLILFCSSALADESQTRQFNERYNQSQELAKQGKFGEASTAAFDALQIAQQLEIDQEQIANLQFNLGFLLNRSRRFAQACDVFEHALTNYEDLYGNNDPRLINTLDALGTCYSEQTSEVRSAKKSLRRAKAIAEKNFGEVSEQHARAQFRMGQAMLMFLGDKKGQLHVSKSLDLFNQLKGPNSDESLAAQFTLAKYQLANKKYDKAASRFNNILASFDDPDAPNSRLELSVHGFLVETYEKAGETDLATKHCLAIGRMTPAAEIQNYMPLFKPTPVYPRTALRTGKQGNVIVEFDVNEQGFVKNPRVVAREGSALFDKPSLDVAKRFRYAPRFVDGKAVNTTGVQNRIVYAINRR